MWSELILVPWKIILYLPTVVLSDFQTLFKNQILPCTVASAPWMEQAFILGALPAYTLKQNGENIYYKI